MYALIFKPYFTVVLTWSASMNFLNGLLTLTLFRLSEPLQPRDKNLFQHPNIRASLSEAVSLRLSPS